MADPTQHCKAIILQLKIHTFFFFEREKRLRCPRREGILPPDSRLQASTLPAYWPALPCRFQNLLAFTITRSQINKTDFNGHIPLLALILWSSLMSVSSLLWGAVGWQQRQHPGQAILSYIPKKETAEETNRGDTQPQELKLLFKHPLPSSERRKENLSTLCWQSVNSGDC